MEKSGRNTGNETGRRVIQRMARLVRFVMIAVRNWLKNVADDNRRALPVDDELSRRNLIRGSFVIFLLIVLAAAVTLRFVKLQFIEHEEHAGRAARILGFRQRLLGTRGEIYDRGRNLLASNIRTRDLYVTPRLVVEAKRGDLRAFCDFIAGETSVTSEELFNKCQEVLTKEVPVMVSEVVQADRAKDIRNRRLPGVSVVPCKVAGFSGHASILISPQLVSEIEALREVASVLAATLQIDSNELATKINKALKKRFAVQVEKNISLERSDEIRKKFLEWAAIRSKTGKILRYSVPRDSMHFEETTVRYYPKGRILSNLLGFCDADEHGLSGIEELMDNELRRSRSHRFIALDGNALAPSYASTIYDDSLNGYSVHLTIQYPIQQIVEKVMEDVVREHRPERAYAVMMDPRTGAIMALAQYPNFDFNDKSTITEGNREFHALLCAYEPGSIMKAVTVSSAMDHANLKPDFVVDCENGKWIFAKKTLGEYGHSRFGEISIREVIKKSSNIGSAKLVIENMTEQTFYNYLRNYGFGSRSHLGFYPENGKPKYFKHETNGILKSVEKWYKIDISRIAIGHTISVSPFQMLQAYGAIANGGRMMQPYVIDRIVSAKGDVIRSKPFCKGQPIREISSDRMMECLAATVERGGTAAAAAIDGYNVVGKTGTAVKLTRGPDGKLRYDRRRNTVSFVGMVPAEDPRFVMLLTVDEPKGAKQGGGSVCAKPFAQIASETLRFLQVPPSHNPEELN